MMADVAQRKRTQFYLTIVGLLVCVAAVTAVSALTRLASPSASAWC